MSYVIPPNSRQIGDPNPPQDMDNTADMLGLITRCLATLAGSGAADPAGNTANVTAVQNLVASAVTLLSNPMTTKGDILYANTGGTPTRLPKGTNGQTLTLSGGIPAWTTAAAGLLIQPSGDTTGVSDTANINAALAIIAGDQGGGEAWLAPGTFYVNSTITVPHKSYIHGCGALTRIMYLGTSGACFYMHDPHGGDGSNTANNSSGAIRDLVIDGTSKTTGNRIGIDVGDGWGYRLDHVFIEGFTSAGGTCYGLRIGNDYYFTEKMTATSVISRNNDTQVYMDTSIPGTDFSHGYCDLSFYLYNHAGQNALTVAAGVNLYGGSLKIRGNHDQSNTALTGNWIIGIVGSGGGNSSDLKDMFIDIRMEGNQGLTYSATKLHFGNSGNQITNSFGMIEITGPPDGNGVHTDGTTGQLAFAGIVGTSGSGSFQSIRTSPADGWFT